MMGLPAEMKKTHPNKDQESGSIPVHKSGMTARIVSQKNKSNLNSIINKQDYNNIWKRLDLHDLTLYFAV